MIERFENIDTPRPVLSTRPSVIGSRASWASWILLGAVAVGIGASVRESAAQAGAGKTTFDGVYTEAQSARGEKTSAMSCSVCHGDKLAGTDMGPGVQGPAFRENWSGRSLSELFDKIKTTMPANDPGNPERCGDCRRPRLRAEGQRLPGGCG